MEVTWKDHEKAKKMCENQDTVSSKMEEKEN